MELKGAAWSRTETRLALFAGGLAVLVRLIQYAANSSFFYDETMLALTIGRRNAIGLLQLLDHDQAAPVLFLEIQWLITRLVGMHELALRFMPLVAGMALVGFLFLLMRRVVRADVVVFGLVCLIASPLALVWADQAKPYAGDAAVAALLICLAVRVLDAPTPARWRGLAIAGAIGAWLSSPALFVLAAIAIAFAIAPAARSDATWRARALATFALCFVSATVNYVLFLREASASAYLRSQMDWAYLSPGLPGIRLLGENWGQDLLIRTFLPTSLVYNARIPIGLLLLGLSIAGAAGIARRHGRSVAALFVLPVAVSLGASLARVYPGTPRLQLWLIPSIILLVVGGVDVLVRRLPARAARGPLALAACGVLLAAAGSWTRRFVRGDSVGDRTVVESWRAAGMPQVPVYVAARGAPPWVYYTTDWSRPDTARLDWYAMHNASGGQAFRNAPSRGRPVSNEGLDLVFRTAERVELLGTPSGIEILDGRLLQPEPDSGWAGNEAANIRRLSQPAGEAWLYFAHVMGPERTRILEAIERIGGRPLSERTMLLSALYRVRFE